MTICMVLPIFFFKKINVFFINLVIIFYNISVKIITLSTLCKCIKYKNLDIYFLIYAYEVIQIVNSYNLDLFKKIIFNVFLINLVIVFFYNICLNIITLSTLCKCIQYENLYINFHI